MVIAVNIIGGPLGVGKTTVINHLLSQRASGEQWAVLVNEYGLIGLDAALTDSPPSSSSSSSAQGAVDVREVAGGCICCSAGFMFEVSLMLLLQRKPDRLIIEPSGLAALSGILETLGRKGIREAIDVRSIVCLVDPARLATDLLRDEVQDQVRAADVLLASRVDVAMPAQMDAFYSWTRTLVPPKAFVGSVEHGAVALRLLDRVSGRRDITPREVFRHEHHDHGHAPDADVDHGVHPPSQPDEQWSCSEENPFVRRSHRGASASTFGWVCWSGLVFEGDEVACWLNGLAQRPGVRRVKAALRTQDGWMTFNAVDGASDIRQSRARADSRLEVVMDGTHLPDLDALETNLRACLVG